MVFTQAALAQFFTAQDQMAIPEATRQQLALEGITSVGDFSEFDKDGVKQLANNLQRTGRRIPDPANANATIPASSLALFVLNISGYREVLPRGTSCVKEKVKSFSRD